MEDYIEIVHGDLTVPFLPMTKQKSRLSASAGRKKIRVYERGSQFDLLRKCRSTYMWVSPMPRELLDCYGLIQADCADNEELYCDHLIYPAGAGHKKNSAAFLSKIYVLYEKNCFEFRFLCVPIKLYRYRYIDITFLYLLFSSCIW